MASANSSGLKRWYVIGAPYFWLLLFFLVPFFIVFKLSLSDSAIAIPPYTPTFNWSDGISGFLSKLDFENYKFIFSDPLYVNAYWSSLKIATVATLLGLSTHRDFFKVVLPAGPGAAADGPRPAVAFAARLDPSEYTTLRGRLESKFRSRMVIGDSDPETAAVLADVGQVTASSATPAAEVSFPQTQHAFRIRSDGSSKRPAEIDAATEPPGDASIPPPPLDPTRPTVVLIWIVGPLPR